MKRFCFQIVRVAGFVLLAALTVPFLPVGLICFIKEWSRGEFVPEVMAFRKERQERQRRFLLRKLHEKQMEELQQKANKRKNDFYK